MSDMSDTGFRPLWLGNLAPPRITRSNAGEMLVESGEPLGEFPIRLTDRIEHWANVRPQQVCAANVNPMARGAN